MAVDGYGNGAATLAPATATNSATGAGLVDAGTGADVESERLTPAMSSIPLDEMEAIADKRAPFEAGASTAADAGGLRGGGDG